MSRAGSSVFSRRARAADNAYDPPEPMASHNITVNEEGEGARLDRFLASVLPDHSRSHIQRLIRDGQVRVAGRDVKANHPVKAV